MGTRITAEAQAGHIGGSGSKKRKGIHSEPYLFTGTFIHSSGTRVTLSHLLIAGKRSTTYSEGGRGALRIALTHYKRCPKKDVLAIPTQHSASVQGSAAQSLLEFPTQNPGAQVTLLQVRLPTESNRVSNRGGTTALHNALSSRVI